MPDALAGHEWLIGALVGASVFLFVVTLVLLPVAIVKLPADYFCSPRRARLPIRNTHPVLYALITGAKNLVGAVLVLFGLVMLVTPGQGFLSIVMGVSLLDYPGKYRFERWLVSRCYIWRALNWIRARAHVAALEPYAVAGTAEQDHGT